VRVFCFAGGDPLVTVKVMSSFPKNSASVWVIAATFQALTIAHDPDWNFFRATSDEELGHLEKYVRRIKDTRLRLALEQAIHERHIWEYGRDSSGGISAEEFNSNDFSVRRVDHFAEFRLGIHVKVTNEFGLYGLFHDDKRDRTYINYYRSDPTFSTEHHLEVIHALLPKAAHY
jgi:hypothetical protein